MSHRAVAALLLAGAIGACARAHGRDPGSSAGSAQVARVPDGGVTPMDRAPPWRDGGNAGQDPTMKSPTASLSLELVVSQRQITMKERGAWKVGLSLENRGAAPVDPRLHESTLTVSGQRAYSWDLAVQNGARDDSWTHLPPGGRVNLSWPLGKALFEKPGDYHLVLRLGGLEAAAEIKVTR